MPRSITGQNITTLRRVSRWAGHRQPVWQVAFSPDSSFAATCSNDGTVRLWDVVSGRGLAALAVDGGRVWSVDISQDSRRVASGHEDGKIRLWEAEQGTLLATLDKHTESVQQVRFTPDGERLLSGGADGLIVLWDAFSGERAWSMAFPGGSVWDACFNQKGNVLAVAYDSGVVRLLDATSARVLAYIQAHRGAVFSADFDNLGMRLVTAGSDNLIRVWDMRTHEQIGPEIYLPQLTSVAFTPDDAGLLAVTRVEHRELTAWDSASGEELGVVAPQATAVGFNQDGSLLAVAVGRSLDVYAPLPTLPTAEMSGLGGPLAPIMEKTAWRMRELAVLYGHEGPVNGVALGPERRLLASCGADRSIRIWNAATGEQILRLNGHRAEVRSVAFSPDGLLLASASGDYGQRHDDSVRLWDSETGEQIASYVAAPGSWVTSAAFTPDGMWVAAVGDFQVVRLWNVVTGGLMTFGSHDAPVNDLAVSRNGYWLVTVAGGHSLHNNPPDNTIRIFDLRTYEPEAVLTGHTDHVLCVSLSPEADNIASVDEAGNLLIWSVEQRRAFGYHEGVTTAAFSPDGSLLAVADRDYNIRLFGLADGRDRILLEGHADVIRRLHFNPEGNLLASASNDGTVRLWGVPE